VFEGIVCNTGQEAIRVEHADSSAAIDPGPPPATAAGLQGLRSTAELERWWSDTILPLLPHDFAVIGRVDARQQRLGAGDIVMYHGELRDDRRTLLAHCASLLGAWRVMRHASLLDLGPCGCVGRHDHIGEQADLRSFLIHGQEDRRGEIVFVVLSAGQWPDERGHKRLLEQLIGPLADCARRLPGISVSVPCSGAHPDVQLTPREIEIGRLLCQGRTNKEIARTLGISPNTVRNQIARISQRLGARNRAQLATLMASAGLQGGGDERG
jgi:DNA-binding CsgD family transcriptional regulator